MFRLLALAFLFNLYSVESQNPSCATPQPLHCFAIALRFYYNTTSKSCESIGCSACPSAHFFANQDCSSCCATKPPGLPLCPVPINDPCTPASVPPPQTTFSFNSTSGKCSVEGIPGCPLSQGGYYANEQACLDATSQC